MIIERLLFSGENFIINDHVTIHNPKLREILEFGEEKYFNLVSALIGNPLDYRFVLFNMGIDFEKVSNFDLFSLRCSKMKVEDTFILLGDLDLSKLLFAKDSETNVRVLANTNYEIVIDEYTHFQMADSLKMMHGLGDYSDTPDVTTSECQIGNKDGVNPQENTPYKPVLQPIVDAIDSYGDLAISTFIMMAKTKPASVYLS